MSCSDDSPDDGNQPPAGGITVDLTDSAFAALNTVGGYAYKGDIIIIRSTDSVYVALSKVCTHQGCTVTYNSGNNNLPCPCHGSLYTINGTVVNGPAPDPLKRYDVKKNGNILTIT
ncbi:MAG: Rieske (2Fe-2S) protein [Draconibacterium sp.]|nr:Rieske (2Fe-2S) protein [Draconibacterium sp.]